MSFNEGILILELGQSALIASSILWHGDPMDLGLLGLFHAGADELVIEP